MKRQKKKTLQDKKVEAFGRMPKVLIKSLNSMVIKGFDCRDGC